MGHLTDNEAKWIMGRYGHDPAKAVALCRLVDDAGWDAIRWIVEDRRLLTWMDEHPDLADRGDTAAIRAALPADLLADIDRIGAAAERAATPEGGGDDDV